MEYLVKPALNQAGQSVLSAGVRGIAFKPVNHTAYTGDSSAD